MNGSDVFTFHDWLGVLEQSAPDMKLRQAEFMFEDAILRRQYEVVGIKPDGEWLYQWVSPTRRTVVFIVE